MSETVGALLVAGRKILEDAGGASGADFALEARWLLAHAVGLPRDRLILHLQDPVTPAQHTAFHDLIARRKRGQPVSQLVGLRAFYGRDFIVEQCVLDPRPETETLIDLALAAPFSHVLDLGTGSGCILATLLAERPDAVGVGADTSTDALRVAATNMDRLTVSERATLVASDWFTAIGGTFDLIVSNPPYISASAFAALDAAVRDWEPEIALTPGGDGLDAYRAIVRDVQAFLRPGGRLVVEIGFDQGPAVASLFAAAGLEAVTVHQDLDARDRVVIGVRQA